MSNKQSSSYDTSPQSFSSYSNLIDLLPSVSQVPSWTCTQDQPDNTPSKKKDEKTPGKKKEEKPKKLKKGTKRKFENVEEAIRDQLTMKNVKFLKEFLKSEFGETGGNLRKDALVAKLVTRICSSVEEETDERDELFEDNIKKKALLIPTRMKQESFLVKGEKIAHVSSGGSHTVIVTDQCNVYAFGRNQNGQLGIGSFEDSPTPKKVVFDVVDDYIVNVSCGDRHTVFLTHKGRVYVCGANFNYQLGLGHNTNMSKPVLVDQMISRKIRRAVCGARHTVLITGKGKIYTAGLGSFGQLGHGDFADQPYFKKIEDIEWLCSSCSTKEHVNVALSSTYEGM
ncbi:predicted protein [Naegleria gruberi]|uniref:Predicted protein n=1 Tax=Naegleria gruberi TaxID=5762 RepID=D2VGR5_NAEGR|nr:uncharacterized protein NAEGRDRAFT_68070 [Naegleria gruberi]EFC44108.1 predicted protein [Naegleria gruberi]|eukprot:XP_002676852.1 predicted protein [Naegleria gruberi strain NEG-M]